MQLHKILHNYILNSNTNDLVIAKCPRDYKWKRAVILEHVSSKNNGSERLYNFKVFFIDYNIRQALDMHIAISLKIHTH